MASNPPFELEDQTDEDFFDKLVDDDDDDDVTGRGLGTTGLPKIDDVSDGNESDEAKIFANLSISDHGNGNDGLETKGVKEGDGDVGEQRIQAKEEASVDGDAIRSIELVDTSSFDHGHVSEGSIMTSETSSALRRESSSSMSKDVNLGEQRVEAKEQLVVYGDAAHSLMSPGSFSFDNGHMSEDGVMACEASTGLRRDSSGSMGSGVKVVQWGSFSESGEHGKDGFGSYSDFFTNFGEEAVENLQGDVASGTGNEASKTSAQEVSKVIAEEYSYSHAEYQGESCAIADQSATPEDVNSAQYWENLYPGWKYDPSTGQWYQLDGSDGAAHGQENFDAAADVQGNLTVSGVSYQAISDVQSSQVSCAQQTAQSSVETVSQFSASENVSGWNNISQRNGEYQYPAHMLFDPQYPGWYYDTIAQEWCSLDAYHLSAQSTDQAHNQPVQNGFLYGTDYHHVDSQSNSNALSSEGLSQAWATSLGDYGQQGTNFHQSEGMESRSAVDSSAGWSWQGSYDPNLYSNSHFNQPKSFDSKETITSYGKTTRIDDISNWTGGSQGFVPAAGAFQQFNHKLQGQQNGPTDYYSGQIASSNAQPLFPNAHQVAYSQSEGRSSAGRPPHALVTFGFGGKLVVMKDSTGGFSSFGSKDPDGRLISVCNLVDVVGANNSSLGSGTGTGSYLQSLCHQSFPGPLVGGSVGTKELNRWIDERIANCESPDMDYGKSKALRLLLSLLKVACKHYGKLRSFGADTGLMENDLPESALAKLFASAKSYGGQFNQYSTTTKCFMTLPSEAQIQATATEVQHLLISGRKKEALQRAQEGQFWEFALILARELGDQFYVDTVKQMAVSQLAVGSPLRTLCLLIAKKPEEVFSNNILAGGNMHGAMHMPQPAENVGYSMLDNWEENLAVITANRTENDHLVIIHMGDCLWKEKNDVTAAHICYLVAEADFELYSDSARLCLIGADHLSFPRTYASPEAIQRTEFFEYTKVLGNSQFALLPLQPYKLVYAHMLAEIGRVSDSLKYCQAIYKSLKTGRSPEADTLKQLLASLEERIKTHQQSGYAANLAPAKIVGKLLNFFDSTAHRVVGGLPPPVPVPSTQGSIQGSEHMQTVASKVSDNRSTMALSSLTPSASMEPISQWAVDGSKMTLQNRSISEPNIGRIPKSDQADLASEVTSSSGEGKPSGTTGTSRFGRLNFGAQILQKTVGLVLKPRQGRQAKLGETNKFYYDEKLKRWVEEGADPPAEESALPPPPTTASFQNGKSDYNLNNAFNDQLHAGVSSPEPSSSAPLGSSSVIPAMPPSSNQYSARGRMGVRSRYVDTFNKGGNSTSTNMFQPPIAPSAKPASVGGAKFFIPTAAPSDEQTSGTEPGSRDGSVGNRENSSMPTNDPFQNLAPSPTGTMHRFPSSDHISSKGNLGSGNNSSPASNSRRTSSWSDIHRNAYNPPTTTGMKASPLSFMPSSHSGTSLPMNGGNFGDDLQEVEL